MQCNNAWQRTVILMCCFLAFIPTVLHGESAIWVETYGEAVGDDSKTIGEAKEEALAKARAAAIEQAAGVRIQSELIIKNMVKVSDFIASLSTGHIVEENILNWETETLKHSARSAPINIYRVYIKAKVSVTQGKPDSSFKITASLNRNIYKEGDTVSLSIKATRDCYILILVITDEKQAYLLFPNKYQKANHIIANQDYTFPSRRDVDRGLEIKAGLLPGQNKAKELIRVIATKNNTILSPDSFQEAIDLDSFQRKSSSLAQLIKELMQIPADERTEAFLAYEITK